MMKMWQLKMKRPDVDPAFHFKTVIVHLLLCLPVELGVPPVRFQMNDVRVTGKILSALPRMNSLKPVTGGRMFVGTCTVRGCRLGEWAPGALRELRELKGVLGPLKKH